MATNVVSSAIVPDVLTKDNYANWSVCVKNYLLSQDLWDTVETESKPEENEAEFKNWRKKNATALHAIQISCGPGILSEIRKISSAKAAWDFLAKMDEPQEFAPNRLQHPLELASIRGYKDMVRSFYMSTSPEELGPNIEGNIIDGATVLSNCIAYEIFDVALDLLQKVPKLAFAKDYEGNSPVFILSRMPEAFHSGTRLVFWKRWIYKCINAQPIYVSDDIRITIPNLYREQTDRRNVVVRVFGQLRGLLSDPLKLFGIKHIYDTKLIHVQAIELLRMMCKEISTTPGPQLKEGLVYKAIFEAIEHGIVEFIEEIITVGPNLLHSSIDENMRNVLMRAIEYRQDKIFRLIYGFNDMMVQSLKSRVDKFGNNMLHLAGMLAPPTSLDRINGAALQMQGELQWFKKVECIVHPSYRGNLNGDGKTPPELFIEKHTSLAKAGEKWMKEAAQSSATVSALIVTIMFAAAFTVPGGYTEDIGLPIFLRKKFFMIFILSDAISLICSTTSLMTFLEILTSSYAKNSFRELFTKKMAFGLGTLFISIGTMMIAFCSTLFLMLAGQSMWVFISIIFLASVPVILFIFWKFPLTVDILISIHKIKQLQLENKS